MATSSSSAGPAAGSGPTSTASAQAAGPESTGAQKIEIEVLGARGESIAEFAADGKAKAPRASFSKPSQADQADKEDSVLNRTPEQESQRKNLLPDYIEKQYFKTGKRYYSSQNNSGQHYFEDRGNRIIANRAHPAERTAQIAVDIAKAREWKAIEVTGTKEFRREAWMKASLAGMTVTGYEPSERDEAELAHKRAASPTETKEQIENAVADKTPEQTAIKQAQEAAEQDKPGERKATPETTRQSSAKTAEAAAEAATIYTLSTASAQANERRVFDKAEDAMRAFLNTDAKEAPHLVESKEDVARTIGQTSLNNGIRTHVVAAEFKELERDMRADGQATALKAEQLSAIRREETAQKVQVAMDEMERVNREAATRFASEKVKASVAVKEHPKLAGPYAVLGAYNAKLKDQGHDEQARKSALAVMRNTLAQRIERGHYDAVKTQQVRFPQRDAQEQRTQIREQTAAETLSAM
ncbi:Putative enzyme (fragment) [Thiomonas arsenitoxydans]